ncbi:MAG: NAD(P)-dependent oxidoreductase [Acidobacteria bacterium]|nr:NAD(P)-dependent oxidoreductase [Acidobacteriota bacterium]
MNVGFIGTGNMGEPMARNLIRAGHTLTVYNRTRKKAEALAAEGARIADSAADAARESEVVISMLADDRAVSEAAFGDRGIVEGLKRNAVHVSMSTISVSLSKCLTEVHASRGQNYVAATVIGRPEAAAKAQLWVVAAGPTEQVEKCMPLFEALARGVSNVGREPSAANVVKLGANFMIASMIEAFGESFAMVRKSGIDPHTYLDVVTSAFNSPVYANYGRKIADEAYEPAGFKLAMGLKDIRLVQEAAEGALTPMPLAGVIRDRFLTALAHGKGDLDWAAVATVSAEDAGVTMAAR